ncbi:C6 transcription factor [Aspergillus steynii IBT 23096]|uniref:C6 transcription factor n=1 Tax=Aspergillus steynii IBT 23096 TaxID=1392250 RepID=A0A2I2FTB2_9EURO|nr:C6 transcription factor [Aspergillus steynii IBT 23096]PLB43888.1 C6 transcription factor [Aspergillus steynii IBT 23096]
MVYRGKPSKSCRECRRRDIKCDKKKDGCSQCSRAHIPCSRYADPAKLMIHDETHSTIARARQKRVSQGPSCPGPLSLNLLPTVEDRAKLLYASQYIGESSATSLFSLIRVFYPPKPDPSSLLGTAVRTTFLAFFSSLHESSSVLYEARVNYGLALTLARKAIQSPEQARTDATLFCLLLLSVFERFAHSGQGELLVSDGHLQGALGLMFLRDDSQFEGSVGITMLLQLSELIAINCLANESDIPSSLLSLRLRALRSVDSSSPRWRFSEVLLQYAHLKNLIRTGLPHAQAILRAELLDHELDQLSQELLPRNQVPLPLPEPTGQPDRCPDHKTRKGLNNIRVVRILLAESIREQSTPLLRTSTDHAGLVMERLHRSTRTSSSLSLEICSSIPYSNSGRSLTSDLSSVQVASLSFHLYVAKEAGVIPDQLRLSILEQMQALQQKQLPGHQRLLAELQERPHQRPNVWKSWLKFGKEDFSV